MIPSEVEPPIEVDVGLVADVPLPPDGRVRTGHLMVRESFRAVEGSDPLPQGVEPGGDIVRGEIAVPGDRGAGGTDERWLESVDSAIRPAMVAWAVWPASRSGAARERGSGQVVIGHGLFFGSR